MNHPASSVARLCLCVVVFSLILTPISAEPLIARGDRNYPPYEFLDESGEPTGFNVDLFLAVAEVMDLEVEVRLGEWTEVRRQLEAGEIDLLIGMFYSDSRDRLVDFSLPHSIISHSIFVRNDSRINDEADLEGKEILVQAGDIVHDYLLENHLTDRLIPVADQREALQLLDRGYHDAAFISRLQGLYFQEQLELDNVRTIEGTLIPRRYCFAVSEGDQELLAMLNEGLHILKLNGTYDRIYDRWFGVLEERDAFRRVRRFLIPTGIAALAAILLLIVWTGSLRRQVAHRTRHLREEINRRKEAEETLLASKERVEESLREKEVLLAEIHHRVKNNLQIINSLLELQRHSSNSPEIDRILKVSQSRINSMAIVHEKLYGGATFTSIELKSYLNDLTASIASAYQTSDTRVRMVLELEEAEIDLDRAIPLGLVVSEIITNSFRHAFPPGSEGTVELRTALRPDGRLELTLSDDGIGRGPLDDGAAGLGSQLIPLLVEQIGGSVRLEGAAGTRYTIVVPFD